MAQSDILLPVCFTIALKCLMRRSYKDSGVTVYMLGVLLSWVESADDAALIESIDKASNRTSIIAKGSRELSDMEVRIDKNENDDVPVG